MPEKEQGLYMSGDEKEFKTLRQIQTDQMYEGEVSVSYPGRKFTELSFEELTEEMIRRSSLRQEGENKEYSSTIEISTERPIGLVWWADVHGGNQQVDYERLKWEAEEIKRNPYLRLALGGDFADSFIWNPSQFGDIANINEQKLFLNKMIEYVGCDKILFAVVGNHEKWARRAGLDVYHDLRSRIPIFDGIGTVRLRINGVEYIGAVMHKPKGSSYLDPNFGGKRFLRENEGYDFVLTAHNHEGGAQVINRNETEGVREVVLLAGKTFKETDDWHDTEGFRRRVGKGIGSNGIIFDHLTKEMLPMSSMAKMIKHTGKFLSL